MPDKILYLPGLNGLRAIAALSVIVCHTTMHLNSLGIGKLYSWNYSSAHCAVTLFFVLSGFLITFLLLKEKEKVGVTIKNFYVRRVLRIFPIYYLYILICLAIGPIVNMFHDVSSFKILWFLFFLGNISPFFGTVIEILGHYWSIGLEEQFYLLWPLIIKFNKKYISILIISIIIIFITLKISGYFLLGKQSMLYVFLDINRFHCILFGALGAVLYFQKELFFLKIVTAKFTQLASWAAFLIISFNIIHIPSLLTDELFSVAVLFIILGQITVRNRVFNLDNRVFIFFGRISYGMYIFHPLVILSSSSLINSFLLSSFMKSVSTYILVISFTTVLAYLSYRYFEMPFLKLKEKFTSIRSANKKLILTS